ncbi:MAG: rod shape-determining protein MreC [Solirubrobacteraceae bacterium]
MHGKTVRRRRAVLIALVVLSLILLTAYFGESPGSGPLHGVQRGFLTAVSPIQDIANKVLRPVRQGIDWFGEAANAKSERDKLRRELGALRSKRAANAEELRQARELRTLYRLEGKTGLSSYRGVTSTVVDQSASSWYSTVNIEAGSSSGVTLGDPVVDAEGLIGKVTDVTSEVSQVSLITDSEVEISGQIAGTREDGTVQPKVGDPERLRMQLYGVPSSTTLKTGQIVVTSGTIEAGYRSVFPAGIPIGKITSIEEESAYDAVDLRPVAELHGLDVVRVLTPSGSRVQRIASQIASMPAGRQASATGGAAPLTGYAQVGPGG